MQVKRITDNQSTFKAKVSPNFIKCMENYFNSGSNRLKNHYRLVKKLSQYESFGYDEYTINIDKKYLAYGTEYKLIATKDNQDIKNGIVLAKRDSFRKIVNKFMDIRRNEFLRILNRK